MFDPTCLDRRPGGDYLEASISRRGFSHVPIPNYRLPLHGPFSADSFSLQPSAPSLLVLPNSAQSSLWP